MMYITNKFISRRTVLKGVGVTMALPFLDAMVPAGRALAAARKKLRLMAIEIVHGSAGSTPYGIENALWAPGTVGPLTELTPILSSLEPLREHLTLVSNTDVVMAEAQTPTEVGGDHYRSSAVWLTQMHPKQTQGSDARVGVSMDQVHAERVGQETPIPSMQLCIENVDGAGGCAYGYSCVYTDSLSWATPTQPLPMIRDPRVVFDQLFGVGATPEERARRRAADRIILDWLTGATERLTKKLGTADRVRLSGYLENVREIEQRIQKIEAHNRSGETRELPSAPVGVPDSFSEHVQLMFDLQLLAFASDITRVFTFKLGRDTSGRVYPETGINKSFHSVSHHGQQPNVILELTKINAFHVSTMRRFLEQLKSTPDEDGGNMLDNSLILYGSPMGDSNVHGHKRVPLLLAGHAGGQLKGGLHLKAADGTTMANVLLSMLQMLGHEELKQFGDSTGAFDLNTVSKT
jgi:hypothetical protein